VRFTTLKQLNSQTCSLYTYYLTLILLTWRIGWTHNKPSKWQMGFNSVFKGLKYLTLIPLMWRIGWAANKACNWHMGFNSAFKGLINAKYNI
jgi:hypothetical protein